MKQYIGTKIISAKPMTKGDFNKYKGYENPKDPDTKGYMVVYPDGYESWSPANVFEKAYRPLNISTDTRLKPGDTVHHFKGKDYIIIDFALHSETDEMMVMYKALYEPYKTFVRPYDMFMSEVDREKYPDVKQKYRFEKVAE